MLSYLLVGQILCSNLDATSYTYICSRAFYAWQGGATSEADGDTIAVGQDAKATVNSAVAIARSANVPGTLSIDIGDSANASTENATNGTVIGHKVNVTAVKGVALDSVQWLPWLGQRAMSLLQGKRLLMTLLLRSPPQALFL